MKKFIQFFCLLLATGICYAQPTFYGLTSYNTISKYSVASNSLTAAYSFKTKEGLRPISGNGLCKGPDGKLYGMTNSGGFHYGVIFKIDPFSSEYTVVHIFNYSDGGYPTGALTLGQNGLLYGMTNSGGANNNGVIFSFNPGTSVYVKLKDLEAETGWFPYGNLMQAADKNFYGMTSAGGAFSQGVIFCFNPLTSIYTKIFDFNGSNGSGPNGSLIQGINGKLYGMTLAGGNHPSIIN